MSAGTAAFFRISGFHGVVRGSLAVESPRRESQAQMQILGHEVLPCRANVPVLRNSVNDEHTQKHSVLTHLRGDQRNMTGATNCWYCVSSRQNVLTSTARKISRTENISLPRIRNIVTVTETENIVTSTHSNVVIDKPFAPLHATMPSSQSHQRPAGRETHVQAHTENENV